MDFGSWSIDGRDPLRRKRLAAGYVVGLLMSAGLVGLVIVNSKAIVAEKEEEILDVQLATEPEPEPEPAPAPQPQAEKKPPPPRPRIETPMEVPVEKPAEVDTKAAVAGEDPFARADEPEPPPTVEKPIVKEAPKPPPPRIQAPPKPKGPMQVTEDMAKPVAISQATPAYPPDARANGIEGTVVVKYVITETGTVTNIQIVRGPTEFHAAVKAAMQSWRFRPAMLEGKPVSVSRIHRFPFRIRT